MRRKNKPNVSKDAQINSLTEQFVSLQREINKGTSRKKKRDKLRRREKDLVQKIEKLRGSKFGEKDLEAIKKELKSHSWDDIWSNVDFSSENAANYKYHNMVKEEDYDLDIEKLTKDAESGDKGASEVLSDFFMNQSRRLGLRR